MYDHIGLKVRSIEKSVRFYGEALAPLGLELCSSDASSAGFGPKDAPALWLYLDKTALKRAAHGPHVHVALRAADRKSVDRFHEAGLAAGGKDHGAPGVRADYAPKYYAAFLLDPDGNNVEAVCMR